MRVQRAWSLRIGAIVLSSVAAIGAHAQRGTTTKNACENGCYTSCMERVGIPRGHRGPFAPFTDCYDKCVTAAQCRPAPAAPSRVGAVYPKYQILTILYAPPGCTSAAPGCSGASEVSYESGSSNGTRVSAGRSFTDGTDISVDAGLSVPGLASLNVSASMGFSVTASDGSSQTISKAKSTEIRVAGNADGVNYGQDQFVLLLNPAVGVRVGQSGSGRDARPKTWWTIGHTGPAPIVYTVYASELRDPSTMRPSVAAQLKKLGFTNEDFATILAQDPFASGATSIDPARFLRTTWTFPYEPPLQNVDCNGGVCTCAAFSGTIRNDMERESSTEVQTQYTVGYSVSGGPQLPAGGTLASLNIKNATSFTWTNSASRTATTSASQSASATVVCPSTSYTGPTLMAIYWDSLYGSFVFAPLDFAGGLKFQGKLPGGKRGEVVDLTYGGRTYHTVTGRDGTYRFALAGAGATPTPTGELFARGARQVVNVAGGNRGDDYSRRVAVNDTFTNTRTNDGFRTAVTFDAGMTDALTQPSVKWVRCAAEGETCAFSGTRQVRYGTNGKYAIRSLTGGTACNNTVFGDPAPGIGKVCEIQNDLFDAGPLR